MTNTNNAAEEGGLPDEGFLYGYFRKNGKHFDMLKRRPNVHTLSSGWMPLYTTKEAADRASRQVANKAEVIDYSIKKGDTVYTKTWSMTSLEVVDVNWALRAIAVRLGPTGGVVIWPAVSFSKTPYDGEKA